MAQVTTRRPLTLVGAPAASPSLSGQQARHEPPRRQRVGRRPARAVVLAAAAVAVAAVLAGWLLAGHGGPAYPGAHQATTPVTSAPASPRLAQLGPAALAGQPLPAVRRQLRHEGLHVRVACQPTGHQQPGTVLSVQPAGQLPPGTTVLVTAALPPPGHRHGNGDGQGDGQGN